MKITIPIHRAVAFAAMCAFGHNVTSKKQFKQLVADYVKNYGYDERNAHQHTNVPPDYQAMAQRIVEKYFD